MSCCSDILLCVHFIGRDGLTHNMLNDIHNHWKHDEAVRIKCMGVPTVDMKNVCTQLEVVYFSTITIAVLFSFHFLRSLYDPYYCIFVMAKFVHFVYLVSVV